MYFPAILCVGMGFIRGLVNQTPGEAMSHCTLIVRLIVYCRPPRLQCLQCFVVQVLECITDNLFKSHTISVNNTPGFLYSITVSSLCRLMKLASLGEYVYVCDIGRLLGIEFVVPLPIGLASVVVTPHTSTTTTEL
jgi:hypothetical protein